MLDEAVRIIGCLSAAVQFDEDELELEIFMFVIYVIYDSSVC